MALSGTGITTSLVASTLGISTHSVGSLCSSAEVNIWSKWKPIGVKCTTMTSALLESNNYGFTWLYANSASALATLVTNAGGCGFTYKYPSASTGYRLGDFRYYNHSAPLPVGSHYSNGMVIKTGGATIDEVLIGLETPGGSSATDYLGIDDIYPSGCTNRGCFMTNGNYSYWCVGSVPWSNSTWRNRMNGTVTVTEFMTNIPDGESSMSGYSASSTDKFYALPYGRSTITVDNTTTQPSSQICTVLGTFTFPLSGDLSTVRYSFALTSVGDTYSGGTISNLRIYLYTGINGTGTMISSGGTLASSVTLGSEDTTKYYNGTLSNSTGSSAVYVCIYWNNQCQWSTLPMSPIAPQTTE